MADAFDLIVIGGGSGGSAVARRAAGYGAKVAIIERGVSYEGTTRKGAGVGGTCVNVGCVPKKLMFACGQFRESMVGGVALGAGYGFSVPESAGQFDWAGFKARRDAYVKKLNGSYETNWAKAGIEMVTGLASFADAKTVKVQGADRTLTAPHIVVACGGEPKLPEIPGIEHAISSDGFFDLPAQPKKAAVLGAGYIAVEMAGIFHGLGTDTSLFFRGETVLRRGFDPYIVEALMKSMKEHGPKLFPGSTPKAIEKGADGLFTLVTESGERHGGFDCVLSAIGRSPVSDLLGLGNAGIDTDRGFIKVDEYENTSVPGIYAIGDVTTTGYELTPVAIAAGRRLGDRLFGNEPKARIEYGTIATVVFSHPPIGTIGLTEPDARKAFGEDNVTVKQATFGSMMYAMNPEEQKVKTALKIVLAGPEEKVVGLHCIGPQCDEMMQGFAIAVRMGATRRDFEASVAIHPTISEEFVTFGGWGQKDGKPQVAPYVDGSRPPASKI